jgi:hypothetical protein
MMFNMIVHIPVQKPVNPVHIDCTAVKAMIQNIFLKPGMLGQSINRHQPAAQNS